jgi:prepilin-type N-terminal cleavage/methylation domain-containing protein
MAVNTEYLMFMPGFLPSGRGLDRRGFTLIETLVAMMVLAISFVVIMQLFSGGLTSSRISGDYLYGMFHAQEKMDEFLLSENPEPGTYEGEFDDGYAWTAVLTVLESDDPETQKVPLVPVEVAVAVRWPHGAGEKTFSIKSMMLAERAAMAGPNTE